MTVLALALVLVLVLVLVLESADRVRVRVRDMLLLALVAACSSHKEPPQHPDLYRGMASWYGESQMTASGERFDKHAMTAAHRSLPMGTRVRVTNQHNGKSVVVRINDRGPYSKNRIIDLSEAAARVLGMIEAGVVPVTLEVVR